MKKKKTITPLHRDARGFFQCTTCQGFFRRISACESRGLAEYLCATCEQEMHREVRPICDFCSGRPVVWTYPADTFRAPHGDTLLLEHQVLMRSIDDWAACDTCHDFIEAGQWEALAQWAYERFYVHHPEVPRRSAFVDELRATHAKFREYRTGKAYRDGTWPDERKEPA
jgi:hypothetical protein